MTKFEKVMDFYGIYLPKDILYQLAKKFCPNFSEEEYELNSLSFDEDIALKMKGNLTYLSHFTGNAVTADDIRKNRRKFDDDDFYFIPLTREPTLFKAAYPSMNDIIREINERTNNMIPMNFDYANNLCHFVGTVTK